MFFAKLSGQNIRKNLQVYLPFFIAMILMVAINTMIYLLVNNVGMETLTQRGGLRFAFYLGQIVIVLFTWIFAIYANQFVMKQRTRELGLFHILGLGKRELYQIVLWEMLYGLLLSLVAGLLSGFVLFKFTSLVLMKMLAIGEIFTSQMTMGSIVVIFFEFFFIFSLLFALNCRQIHRTNPIELLTSHKKGEQEPKARKKMTMIGLLSLSIGYGIALTIHSPIQAMFYFFIAVLFVLLGTYLLFIGGSITLLKFLKKRPNIYYRPQSFIAISGMMYRMKQHAAGLASICILSTMSLITIAMTASLYFGRQAELDAEYAYDITFTPSVKTPQVQEATYALAQEMGIEITDSLQVQTRQEVPYGKEANKLQWVSDSDSSIRGVTKLFVANYYRFMTLDEYNRVTHSTNTLNDHEVIVDQLARSSNEKTIAFQDSQTFQVKKVTNQLASFFQDNPALPTIVLVFSDEEPLNHVLEETISEIKTQQRVIEKEYRWSFNFKEDDSDKRLQFVDNFSTLVQTISNQRSYSYGLKFKDLAVESNRLSDASFFFIGLLLSSVFLLATTLIIYFKQISEGLEDRRRFIIMQKVGMSRQEVKQTIRQQVTMIFSLPIVVALSHLLFAFPMMKKLLFLFEITQVAIFVKATIGVVSGFILLYLLVYVLTAKVYYQLVEREG